VLGAVWHDPAMKCLQKGGACGVRAFGFRAFGFRREKEGLPHRSVAICGIDLSMFDFVSMFDGAIPDGFCRWVWRSSAK